MLINSVCTCVYVFLQGVSKYQEIKFYVNFLITSFKEVSQTDVHVKSCFHCPKCFWNCLWEMHKSKREIKSYMSLLRWKIRAIQLDGQPYSTDWTPSDLETFPKIKSTLKRLDLSTFKTKFQKCPEQWTQKQPKCPSTDELMKKFWYIYTVEYYSDIKRNEIGSFVVMWMSLESVILGEVRKRKASIIY